LNLLASGVSLPISYHAFPSVHTNDYATMFSPLYGLSSDLSQSREFVKASILANQRVPFMDALFQRSLVPGIVPPFAPFHPTLLDRRFLTSMPEIGLRDAPNPFQEVSAVAKKLELSKLIEQASFLRPIIYNSKLLEQLNAGIEGTIEDGLSCVMFSTRNHIIYISEEKIQDFDVLCGRGGRSNHHVGNKRYRQVVSEMKAGYRNIDVKSAKTDLSRLIVEYVHGYGGRFVRMEEDGKYRLLTVNEARKKTSQALREIKELKWTLTD